MSIEYRAIYGYGFHLTSNDVASIGEEEIDRFYDSPYTVLLNSWGADPDYFFGIIKTEVDEGEIAIAPHFNNPHKVKQMKAEFERFFPWWDYDDRPAVNRVMLQVS